MNSLSSLLDQLGVGRPLPDGTIWTRARFAKALGLSPSDLGVKRAGRRTQQDLALACVWALVVRDGRTPDGWEAHPHVRTLAEAILSARRAARGEARNLLELPLKLVEWGICPSSVSATVVAEHLIVKVGARLAVARERFSWPGVLAVVREVLA